MPGPDEPQSTPTGADMVSSIAAADAAAAAARGAAAVGMTLTDASIASATGASQTIAAANADRSLLNISNPGTASWWINETGGTAAANAAGCFELQPGARWAPRPSPVNAVTGIGTAAAKLTVVTG